MTELSPQGLQVAQTLAQQHGYSVDAVTHMMNAVHRGNGSMAQFNHPEFSGSGQWMIGGMTMVSDMFNQQLAARVSNLCGDIAREMANHQDTLLVGSFQSQSQNGGHNQSQTSGARGGQNSLFEPDPATNWWPADLGVPNASGSQNNMRYAYFANSHRLAVSTGGEPWVYDTLNHQIGGFSQQQGSDNSITFTSQFGKVPLSTLPVVSGRGTRAASSSPGNQFSSDSSAGMDLSTSGENPVTGESGYRNSPHNIVDLLEQLGTLREKGIITEEEFATKKAELLARL